MARQSCPTEELPVGKEFKDTAEFREFMKAYQDRTFQNFYISKSDFRKTSEGITVTGEYDRITLLCHRGPVRTPKSASGSRPFQQTFKNDCPAKIKLSYHKRTNSLVVVASILLHNHELVAEHFALQPSQRRLTPAERDKAKELLAIGTSAAAIRNAMIQQTGKKVQSKDVHNIRTAENTTKRAGRSSLEILKSVITAAVDNEKHLMVRSSINELTKELDVIMFVTPKMKESYERFPEVLFMDSTYMLNAENYPLYMIAAQDSSGYTRPVAVGFVTKDTKINITAFLQLFKQCHEPSVLQKTAVVFVDKDQKEIDSIRKELQHCRVLLCWFHVLKSFKTTIAEYDEPQLMKKTLYSLIHKLVHSASEGEFDTVFYQLIQTAPQKFYQYITQNWTNIKDMWVWYERKNLRTLGNNTTNRIEALNRAIKALFHAVKRTRMDFADCVETLLKFLSLNDGNVRYSEFLNAEKTPYVNHAIYGAALTKLGKHLTKNALQLIFYQFQKYDKENAFYAVEEFAVDSFTLKNQKTDAAYSIQAEPCLRENDEATTVPIGSMLTCNCFFNCAYGLFCRHILHIRKRAGSENDILGDCVNRWRRDYHGADVEFLSGPMFTLLESHVIDDQTAEFAESSQHAGLSREKRYGKALVEAKALANLAADFGGSSFQDILTLIQTVTEMVQSNCPARQIIVALRSSETARPPREDIHPVVVPENSPLQNNKFDEVWETINAPTGQHQLNFVLPTTTTRPPGRPKGATAKKSFSKKIATRPKPDVVRSAGPSQPSTTIAASVLSSHTQAQQTHQVLLDRTETQHTKEPTAYNLERDNSPEIVWKEDTIISVADFSPLREFFTGASVDEVEKSYVAGQSTLGMLTEHQVLTEFSHQTKLLLISQIRKVIRSHLAVRSSIDYSACLKLIEMFSLEPHGRGLAQHAKWVQPVTTVLYLRHRNLIDDLEDGGWVDDTIITAAGEVLRNDYPDTFGLRSPMLYKFNNDGTLLQQYESLVELRSCADVAFHESVLHFCARQSQILHVGGNHWIVVSNIHETEENVVDIYDSLGPTKLSDAVVQSIASCFRFSNTYQDFSVRHQTVDKQLNGKDCGIRAIATAEALCVNDRPSTIPFASSKAIRGHLRLCLETGSFKANGRFPRRNDRAFGAKKPSSPEDPTVHPIMCVCRMPKTPPPLKFGADSTTDHACNEPLHFFIGEPSGHALQLMSCGIAHVSPTWSYQRRIQPFKVVRRERMRPPTKAIPSLKVRPLKVSRFVPPGMTVVSDSVEKMKGVGAALQTPATALEKARVMINMKHGLVRLHNVWGVAGSTRPIKQLIKKIARF